MKYNETKPDRIDLEQLKNDIKNEVKMSTPISQNGWSKYEYYVINEIKELKEKQEKQQEQVLCEISRIDRKLTEVATKVAVYGGFGGLIGGAIVSVLIKTVMQ